MTTEVLRNMIYAGSATLDNLGFVVMDEVHYLADRFRGAVWEEVIIGLAESIQLVALSATVSNAEEFGDWLSEVRGEMAVVVSERRPVPLFQHVLVGKRLYDLFADEAPTAVALPSQADAEVNPTLVKVSKEEARHVRDDSRRPRGRSGKGKRTVAYGSGAYGGAAHRSRTEGRGRATALAGRGVPGRPGHALDAEALLPAIVFIFSRVGCDAAVGQLLGSGLRLTNAEERAVLAGIADRHVAGLSAADLRALDYDKFVEALQRGIAAHHAGMLPAFKEAVEEAFVKGLVKVVFATETLALGINMPARSVVLEKLVKYNGETHADITPGEYTQLTGRAGRRGIDVEGHAVVVWQPGLDPTGGGRAGLAADVPAEELVRADLQHGRQPGRGRRTRSGPVAAGAVVRPVPDRPLGGRDWPGRWSATPRRSPSCGPERRAIAGTSRRTPGCAPRSARSRPRRAASAAPIAGPRPPRSCSP